MILKKLFVICVTNCLIVSLALGWTSGLERTPGPEQAKKVLMPGDAGQGNHPNEHGTLLQEAMSRGGIPLSLGTDVFTLQSFVDGGLLVPSQLAEVTGLVERPFNIAGFAGQPDHSHSVWDWATGNETCPAGARPGSARFCHAFSSHLGIVNANHFPPQSQITYQHYHTIALNRANECSQLYSRLENAQIGPPLVSPIYPLLIDSISECEQEALLFEAFGQHFLQDAWAIGHMWQRWGTADFTSLPNASSDPNHAAAVGILVGMEAGMLHGAESVLPLGVQDDLSSSTNAFIQARHRLAQPWRGTGDIHAGELLNDGLFQDQEAGFLECSAVGIRAVYEATAQVNGSLGPLTPDQFVPGQPVESSQVSSQLCFGQRVTAEAIRDGFGLSTVVGNNAVGSEYAFDLAQDDASVVISDELRRQWRAEHRRLRIRIRAETDPFFISTGTIDPTSTTMSRGGAGFESFMGVLHNGDIANNILAPFLDPILQVGQPWPLATDDPADSSKSPGWSEVRPTRAVARLFSKAHMDSWCKDDEANPYVLRDSYFVARGSAAPSAPVKLEVCHEFAKRHVRLGSTLSACDIATGGTNDPWPIQAAITDDIDDYASDWCKSVLLGNLALSGVVLSPAFDSSQFSYTSTVDNGTTETTVTAITEDPGATLEINGIPWVSGMPFGPVGLNVGTNTITILVSAPDAVPQLYTVNVTRADVPPSLSSLSLSDVTLQPSFDPSILNYTATVDVTISETVATPTTDDPNAIIRVIGRLVESGLSSEPLPLIIPDRTVYIDVASPTTGQSTRYNVVVTRQLGTPTSVTINFDELSAGEMVRDQYVPLGLLVKGNCGHCGLVTEIGTDPYQYLNFGNSNPNVMHVDHDYIGFNVILRFVDPANPNVINAPGTPSVSMLFGTGREFPTHAKIGITGVNNAYLLREIVYTESHLESVTSADLGGELIRTISISRPASGWSVGIDDLQFESLVITP